MAAKGTKGKKGTQRKLTAILSADVVGYSRLMGADEAATVETITAYRKIFFRYVKEYRGRIVNAPGDSILAEFASVVDAVNGAVEIQRELAEKNAELPDDRRMDFRIGINLGDVIVKDDVIYGDGVNIAARLESLAEPGGICVSRHVYDHVRQKLNLEYEYLGEQQVKNIAEPVRAYLINLTQSESGKQVEQPKPDSAQSLMRDDLSLKLPDKPSIAVLAFENISGDPEQEYFSDGISEDIITTLSKIPELFVVARNSSFSYKGRPVKLDQVGRELGVSYVLEGSVRKAGNQVRITAQLINAGTGLHLWADRYDRELTDLFATQDEISLKIVKSLQVKLTDGEMPYLLAKSTENLKAWEALTQAHALSLHHTREDNAQALKLAEKAIELDPGYAAAINQIGWAHLADWRNEWSKEPDWSFQMAEETANRCLAVDNSFGMAYALLGRIYLVKKQYDKAISAGERACALNPNNPNALGTFVWTMLAVGRVEEALRLTKKAMRLHPYYPAIYLFHLEQVYYLSGRYEESIAASRKALDRNSNQEYSRIHGVASLTAAGRKVEARAQADEILKSTPTFSAEFWGERIYGHYMNLEIKKRFVEELIQAGLPE